MVSEEKDWKDGKTYLPPADAALSATAPDLVVTLFFCFFYKTRHSRHTHERYQHHHQRPQYTTTKKN
jgi:hypothetical protein